MKPVNSSSGPEFDLFGNPAKPLKDPRGRPAFAKSKENQRVVSDLAGQGFTHAEIAAYMQCDEKTLRKHFSRELSEGLILLRAEAALVRTHKMRAGNMTAVKQVSDTTELLAAEGRIRKPKSEKRAEPKPAPKGKKEQDAMDAAEAEKRLFADLQDEADAAGRH